MESLDRLCSEVGREDTFILEQSLRLLTKQHAEVLEQVNERRQQILDRLQQWDDFNRTYEHLSKGFTKLESDDLSDLSIEDAIERLEKVGRSFAFAQYKWSIGSNVLEMTVYVSLIIVAGVQVKIGEFGKRKAWP